MPQQRTPPRYVPTLTEVVKPVTVSEPAALAGPMALMSQEQLVHRILQRIDLTLDGRLREAIATVVIEQTRSLGPALRQEIEAVVRKSVAEALEQELTPQGSPRQPGL